MSGGSKRALEQIAQLLGCSVEEAREFCLKVQALRGKPVPSYKSIAQAAKQLELNATIETVASEASKIHLKERGRQGRRRGRRGRGRGRWGRWQSPKTPKYVVIGGVVESTSGWQKREGITKQSHLDPDRPE